MIEKTKINTTNQNLESYRIDKISISIKCKQNFFFYVFMDIAGYSFVEKAPHTVSSHRSPREVSCIQTWLKNTQFIDLLISTAHAFQAICSPRKWPKSCSCFSAVAICVPALITTILLYLLLLPIRLLLSFSSCCFHWYRKSFNILSPKKIPGGVPPLSLRSLTENEKKEVDNLITSLKLILLDETGKLRSFNTNTSPEALSKAPELLPFFKDLERAQGVTCNYNHLEAALKRYNAYDNSWKNIILPYVRSLKNERGHPDGETFPILMHFFLLALNDPLIPKDKKRKAALFISLSASACKPTWGEVIIRALMQLYSKSSLGENQLLMWVQEAKEALLLELHEHRAVLKEARFETINIHDQQFDDEEWHIINGVKHHYGKELGLATFHLQENLSKLTLRQTSGDLKTPYIELFNDFKEAYAKYGETLITKVFKAYKSADPTTQATVHDYTLSLLQNLLNLPNTTAHVDLLESLCDENYELKIEAIAYLLLTLDLIQEV